MDSVFDYKWGNKVVTGEERPEKPGFANFINSHKFVTMLNKHITLKSMIAIHCDVDVDGIGTGYILGRFIQQLTNQRPIYIINRDKEHGISQRHVDYFKGRGLGLMIIVDSSSNELDVIKGFDCDVLVIDHHEISHTELFGKTNDGKHEFVIVNNTLDNPSSLEIKELYKSLNRNAEENQLTSYKSDDRMSCGLVVYELLRIYQYIYHLGDVLENLRLYQWSGVTLFTDSITLNTPRNQWYIENTVHSMETEPTLKTLVNTLNSFKISLDKSTISYTLAPVINKAIRAGASGEVLSTIVNNPNRIDSFLKFREAQENAINIGINGINEYDSYILRDMSNTNVHKNYNGVIASRLCGEHRKNTVVFKVTDGIAEGSFRGRLQGVDYRGKFDSFGDNCIAQGHKAAFGFKCPVEMLQEIMSSLVSIEESENSGKYLLTAGKLNSENPGKFVIDDMDEFKRQGGIWKLGVGNSKVNTDEQIMITVKAADAELAEVRGKLYLYNVLGLQCKAFEPISKPIIDIYIEFSRQIDCYIK